MANARTDYDGQSNLLFQGEHVPDTPMIFDRITRERLDEIDDCLEALIELWVVEREDAKTRIQELQGIYGLDFFVGDPWHNDVRRSPAGTLFRQGYPTFLDDDKEMHVRMSTMCAAEAMISIASMFRDRVNLLRHNDPDAALFNFGQDTYDFAGAVDHSNLAYDFINRRVLPWIESHGVGAFHQPTLRDASGVQGVMMDEFKWSFSRVDECFDEDHTQGTKPYQCTMCVLKLVMTELKEEWNPDNFVPPQNVPISAAAPILPQPAPTRGSGVAGRGGIARGTNASRGTGIGRGTGAGVGATRGTGANRGGGRGGPSANAVAAATAAMAMGMIPGAAAIPVAPAVLQLPPPAPAVPGQVSGTASLPAILQWIAAQNAILPVTPAMALTMPTWTQFLANGSSTNPPAVGDIYTPAAIFQRSAALAFYQKPDSLILPSNGGYRYLCNQFLPTGMPCSRFTCRRGDMARHFREYHGGLVLTSNQLADWGQMGPFNKLELQVLRPTRVWTLSGKNDPPHMK